MSVRRSCGYTRLFLGLCLVAWLTEVASPVFLPFQKKLYMIRELHIGKDTNLRIAFILIRKCLRMHYLVVSTMSDEKPLHTNIKLGCLAIPVDIIFSLVS